MLKRIAIALIVSFGVFAMSRVFIFSVTYSLGAHSTFDSCAQLKLLHYYLHPYLQSEGNQLPDEMLLNSIIAKNYQKPPNHEVFENYKNKDYDLLQIAKKISEQDRYLQPWGAPPIYIKDESLPEGFGFYLAGEDGVSKTKGRDPDDLNSWNISSYHFYSQRDRQKESQRITYISLIPASLAFIYLMRRWKNKYS